MSNQEMQIWQAGVTDAPLPPLVDAIDENGRDVFLEYYQKLGSVYRLSRPDNKPLTVLAGSEANVFTARYGDEFFVSAELWKEFDAAMGGMGGGMAANRDGEANHKRRAKSSRNYSRATVLDQLPRMVEITHEYSQWKPEQAIDVLPAMQRIVAEQLGQLMVNHSMGDYLQDFVIYLATSIVSSFIRKQPEALTSPRFLRARERVFELGRIILEEHKAAPPRDRKPDLVDQALMAVAANPESVSDTRLVYAGLGPLLAGLETVARTSSFLLYALLKNPSVLKRVVDEVDQAFVQGPLTWETLKTMYAVQGAAMETLRMYSVGTSFDAIVAQPFTFAGYRLEPGDEVCVAMTVPHFLPELFPHPEVFDIDRYRDPRNEHRQRGAYAPFGLGEHTCLGAGIAEVQLMVIIATLLHTYQFELDPPDYQLIPGQQLTIADDIDASSGEQLRVKVVAEREA